MASFEIHEAFPDGTRVATGDDGSRVMALPDADAKIFKRKTFTQTDHGFEPKTEWLVIETHGVRIYLDGGDIVVTKQNLYP